MSEFRAQWRSPGDVFSVLLIVGGDVILLALACVTGRVLTPVAFSFGWVAYAISAVVAAIGNDKLLGRCPPEIPLKVINLKNGYNRGNNSWLLGRFMKDYKYWMPQEVRECLLQPPMRPDEEDRVSHHPISAPSTSPVPPIAKITLGRSNAALCIAVYRWVDGAELGLPDRDWVWWSGLFVSILQLGIAAIPWSLHNNRNIFIATTAGTVIAYASASLPQWRIEKWTPERRKKDVAITQGNGYQHVIVILGADHGFDMEALAVARAPERSSTRIYTSILALFWLVLLVTCCGIETDTWYLIAVGGLGMVQNLVVAGVPRTPAALGLPIKLDINEEEVQRVPNVFVEPKVMWTIMEFETRFPSCGNALVKEFFPGDLLEWEVLWWASRDPNERKRLLDTQRHKAWEKTYKASQEKRQ